MTPTIVEQNGLTVVEMTLYAIIDADNRILAIEEWLYKDEALQWALDKGINGMVVVLDLYRLEMANIGDRVTIHSDGTATLSEAA